MSNDLIIALSALSVAVAIGIALLLVVGGAYLTSWTIVRDHEEKHK